jgi:hypothetical protein
VPTLTLVDGRLIFAAVVMWVILRVKSLSMPRERRMWGIFAVMAAINAGLVL